MSDAEIIKALECCADLENHYCAIECVYWNKGCDEPLIKDTLNLINRQKAENERLLQKLQQAQKQKDKLMDAQMFLAKTSDEQQAEIERLSVLAELGNMRANDYRAMRDKLKTAKAEAYKECIEKVKEEIAEALESNYKARAEIIDKHNVGDKTDFISYCGGKIDCLRGLDDFLDNLLKEMESANND